MPKWTKEQSDAINQAGKNIIVSAGAGSGKTAVLSERVLTKVLNNVDINRLLILTFTKAAAAEMKKRIRDKIKDKGLINQLNKIDQSYITTFDSYSLSLVKKYHYLLNIKKNIEIMDSNLLNIKIKEYLDMVMEEKYQEENPHFVKLIDTFCLKDDQELRDNILLLNEKLNMKYDKEEYLDHYIDCFYNEEVLNKNIYNYEIMLKDKLSLINSLLTKLSNMVDIDYYKKISNVLLPLINSTDYDMMRSNVLAIGRLPSLPKGSEEDVKKVKDLIKKGLDEIKDLTSIDSANALKENILLTKDFVIEIIDIIKRLDERIKKYKFENDYYDFADISKLAIKIVKENEDIREEIKNYFLEIMVDEYQDTSDLQEELLSLISNNNLYMVGDIKQSIYRFRNANPNIFRRKYNEYTEGVKGIKIDLLKNFRSREEVLSNINLLFNYIMSDDIGGADYQVSHQMIFGNTTYNEEGKTNQNNDLELFYYSYEKEKGFAKDEIEAFIICDDIKKKVENHYQIFDKDKMILRDATYDDFAILIDRTSSFELYKKIFLYNQIPLSIYKDEYLTSSNLFLVLKSIFKMLSLINGNNINKEIEYCYLSIGRSFLFNYDDNYLFKVIKNNLYYEDEIFKKIKNILIGIEDKSISKILDDIINEFAFYDRLRTIPSLNDNLIKIDYLYDLASNLNSQGYTYLQFIDYLDSIMESKSDIKFSLNKEDGESVKIMTIHKSKGLEYHICYFPGLTSKFNDQELKEKIIYSDELGIIVPSYDEGLKNTFYKDLFKMKYQEEEISEKIRLFYVALTRAKEKMIFVLPYKDSDPEYDKKGMVVKEKRLSYHSFADILLSIKDKIACYEKDIDLNKIHLSKDYNLINNANLFSFLKKKGEKIDLIDLPKIEVINKENKKYSKGSLSLIDVKQKEMMDFGTKMHYYLETLDLKKPVLDDIEDEYRIKIEKFLKSDLLKNINDANIYQEYEFIMEDDLLKHGIIDLMLEYSNHIDIIDYKLKHLDDDAYITQLNGYKDYIESISNKKVNLYLYSIMDSIYKKL